MAGEGPRRRSQCGLDHRLRRRTQHGAYYASKADVNSFSAALAAEVAGSGVTVTCLTPGVVRTAFFERCSVGQSRLMKLMPALEFPRHRRSRVARLQGGKTSCHSTIDRPDQRGDLHPVAAEPADALRRLDAAAALIRSISWP
jgi:NAD(P)-dependent dehydrogenase (short-subunit alcohol dehydrogenase family)